MNRLFSMLDNAIEAFDRMALNGSGTATAGGPSFGPTTTRSALPGFEKPAGGRHDLGTLAPFVMPEFRPTKRDDDAASARVRANYIAARFPGVAMRTPNLADEGAVIKGARLYFEDGDMHRATELLDLATSLFPANEALWLARLEIGFLQHDAAGFERTAARFSHRHFDSHAWPEIRELGRGLGLAGELFRDRNVRSTQPDTPGSSPPVHGWLQGAWDFTPEVMLAELRARALANGNAPERQLALLRGAA